MLLRSFVGLVVVLAWMGSAKASGRVYIESYPGQRPRDANRVLQAARSELQQIGFLSVARAGAKANVPGPARVLSSTEQAAARSLLEAGAASFNENEIDRAIDELGRGLALLDAAPVTAVTSPAIRKERMTALILLAQAHKRKGAAVEVTSAMAEILRSYPDLDISARAYGYEPVKMRDSVATSLGADGKGTLIVEVDEPQAVIFVNERYVGVGRAELSDLYPGRYRVFVRNGPESGRVHEIEVEANQPAQLSLQWAFDAALQNSGDDLYLSFTSESEQRELQPRLAHRLARQLDADEIIVLSIGSVDGRRTVDGQLYSSESSRFVRQATVAVEPAVPHDKLSALARFLAGDDDAARLVDRVSIDGQGAAGDSMTSDLTMRADSPGPFRAWKWVTLGAGVAALGTGAVLIYIDRPKTESGMLNPSARNTKTAGIVTAVAGGLLTAASVYMFLNDEGEPRENRRLVVGPIAGDESFGISAAGTF